jgi:hypothetical protein
MKCTHGGDDHRDSGCPPGSWLFRHYVDLHGERHSGMEFVCPCGCGDVSWIPVAQSPVAPDTHRWGWNQNEDAPTLVPSIRRTTQCKFHGYMTDGRWSSCGDGAPLHPQANNNA